MIDLRVFKKHGCDTDSLKKLFDLSGKGAKESEASKKIRVYLKDLIKSGIERSLADYRTWAAVDLAYDAPFHQQTPTIIRAILSGSYTADQTLEQCKSWGLSVESMFCKNKEGKLELNAPRIMETLVPIVRSYVTVRTAKIFNDRNLVPLFKYEPISNTAKNRVRCQMLTNVVQAMSSTMGYSTVLQRMILNSMLYSAAVVFPMEPWFKEEQEKFDGKEDETEITRQGIRYAVPHITRTFYDLQHPLATFNTDTGCNHAGYWTIARYRDVEKNPLYWNKEKITYGFDWLKPDASYRNYFVQAYPCTMELPKIRPGQRTDREDAADYYSQTDSDRAIFVTPIFVKIIPKDWDIGTYKYPVPFRFFIGADDTILHAEPYPYRPITVAQYDPDQGRAKNGSLALEIIPSQDMLGNLLTQCVLTIKQNLGRVTFFDTALNITTQMEEFARRNQWHYQTHQYVPYSSIGQRIANAPQPKDAFHTERSPFQDVSQMIAAMPMIISMLERMLVISPQEIGAAASHQQSKAEVVITNTNTTNRLAYTASFIDEAIDALKAQNYEAVIAYAPDEFVTEVSSDTPNLEKVMKDLGLEKTDDIPDRRQIQVKGKKEHLRLEGFASTRDGPERGNDTAAAQAMGLGIASINQNPLVAQIVDPESVLENLTEMMVLSGASEDTKFRTKKEAIVSTQVADMAQQIQAAAVKEAVDTVGKTVAKPAAEAIAQHTQQIAQNAEHIAAISKIVEQVQQIVANASQAIPLQPPTALDPAAANANQFDPAIAGQAASPVALAGAAGI